MKLDKRPRFYPFEPPWIDECVGVFVSYPTFSDGEVTLELLGPNGAIDAVSPSPAPQPVKEKE